MSRIFFAVCIWVLVSTSQAADWIVGPRPAPAQGNGPGQLAVWVTGSDRVETVAFGEPGTPAGNSFQPGLNTLHQRLYVPTAGGRTVIFDAADLSMVGSMNSIADGRVAAVSPDGNVLVVVSDDRTAAYATSNRERLWQVQGGGNAVAFDEDSRQVYVGGNRSDTIQRISVTTGEPNGHYAVARSGDLVRIHDQLYSADMKTGVVSVVDLSRAEITAIETPEVDPQFDYERVGSATAGLMQLAADPQGHRVYAAGFSGNILVFDSDAARYLGSIAVDAGPPGGPDKLSGLALFDDGRKALVTVENLGLAVVVDLETQQIVRTLPGADSNRWLHLTGP